MSSIRRTKLAASVGAFLLGSLVSLLGVPAFAATNVLSNRYDDNRTAANLTETTLTPQTVSASTFGKLWSYSVDGAIFAQPLYVQSLAVAGTTSPKNVLFVATMHDVVYAFDADSSTGPLWCHDFRNPNSAGGTLGCDFGNDSLTPGVPFDTTTASDAMGIVGTPVIDLASNTMYVVAETTESASPCPGAPSSEYVQRIHALDIRSGAGLGSTEICGNAKGVAFDPKQHTQRPGLAISAGQVWLAFGSTIPGDWPSWHGWVMTYDEITLAQTGIFVTSAGDGAGIWQSGGAPAIDAQGNVYYLTGNGNHGGNYDGADGVNNFQESLMKFTYSNVGGLKLTDFYTAANWQTLDTYDLDLTCNGPMLVPGTGLVAFGSKTATTTVLNTANLGGLQATTVQSIQTGTLPANVGNNGDRIIGLAYWQRSTQPQMYIWPGGGGSQKAPLTSYTFNGSTFTQNQQNSVTLFGEPSAALSLSANGGTPGSGILWAAHNLASGRKIGAAAVVEAYDAGNIGTMLWSSPLEDDSGNPLGTGRFVIPVVNSGKMYMAAANGSGSGSVQVYGLLRGAPLGYSCNNGSECAGWGQGPPPPAVCGTAGCSSVGCRQSESGPSTDAVCCGLVFNPCSSSQDCCAGTHCVNGQCLIDTGAALCNQPLWTASQEDSACASGTCNEATGNCDPSAVAVTPQSGPASGGTQVTLCGPNVCNAATVTFGGVLGPQNGACITDGCGLGQPSNVLSATPPHAPGTVQVVLQDSAGNVIGIGSYTYTIPVPALPGRPWSLALAGLLVTLGAGAWLRRRTDEGRPQRNAARRVFKALHPRARNLAAP